ncbi:MAG: aspartate/glutamate racemase family protein [Anaerolineales bacterium]
MKTMGLIGGISWESSIKYYRITNQLVRERLGGHHSAKSIMYSFDFAEIEALQREGDWTEATRKMINAAIWLQKANADFVVICANTMHRMAEEVEAAIAIPLLHIADATARTVKEEGITKVGLLGTRFVMEEDFYRQRLEEKYGLQVLVPDAKSRETVDRVIYDELVKGKILPPSQQAYLEIISGLINEGAEGIILGCTEIGMLVKQREVDVPTFDTTVIHASAAVDYAMEE